MSADGWALTDLGKLSGDTFDVRYDPGSNTVKINGVNGPEEFTVDPGRGDWQQQAARELATRGYGARWNRWDDTADGGMVMSAARTRYQDVDRAYRQQHGPGADDYTPGDFGREIRDDQGATDDAGWERGAASWTPDAGQAETEQRLQDRGYEPPELGRVRVYPQYHFPVYQSGPGGIGLDQQITVTDWDKQGRDWAETEARRQVTEALGESSNDAPGGPWWMGGAKKDEFRWQPYKGTPRSAKPFDGMPEPAPWQPERPETGAETGETVPRNVQDARDRTERLHNERVRADEDRVRADAAAGSEESTFLSDGTEITPADRRRLIDEAAAAGTPHVRDGSDVQPGDRVRDNGNGELATVTEVNDRGGVTIDYGRELTPGVPGSQRCAFTSLEDGALQKVPQDATPASLEDRRPPAEQAERYAARQAHYAEQHGPGKRGKKGWTAHKRGCRVCADIDAGGDGVGRKLQVVAPPAAAASSAPADDPELYPVRFTYTGGGGAGGDEGEVRHWAWEAALGALQDQVGGWGIPDDGTGVLDADAFIASIGAYVGGVGVVLSSVAERLGGGQTPIAPVVGELMAEFATALGVMSEEAGEVYTRWTENDDNAHDLRRARGEIPGATLFNVA